MESPPELKKAVLYARVSSQEQQEGKTIDSQIEELRRYAISNGYQIIREYKDDGWSGALINRPSLDQLRDDAQRKLFDFVIINDVDRLAREVSHLGIVKTDLEKKGIKVVFRKISNGNSPTDQLMINMLGAFAQFEREMILDRTRRGKRHKVEVRKECMGTIPPYGYFYFSRSKANGEKGRYQINPDEAEVVQKIFGWVGEEGLSARGVVRKLLEEKIPPRKGAKIWAKTSVLRVLKNESYVGRFYFYKLQCVEREDVEKIDKYRRHLKTAVRMRPKSEWVLIQRDDLRIIDEKVFLAAQQQIKRNKTFAKRHAKHDYLLSGGIIKCGKCGSKYYADMMHGVAYYRDGNRMNRFPFKKDCDSPAVSAAKIENKVWSVVEDFINNPDLIVQQLEKNKDLMKGQADFWESELSSLEKKLRAICIQQERLISGYQESFLTSEQVKEPLQRKGDERSAVEKQIAEIQGKIEASKLSRPEPQTIESYCQAIRQIIPELGYPEKRRIIQLLVKEVVFSKSKALVKGHLPIQEAANCQWSKTIELARS